MKELSIEEKARNYDEAIKKAKDMLSYKEVRREDMEYLFPELKESEDERIRKALTDYFIKRKSEGDIDETWYGIPYDTIIALLEKQGEQKPNYCHHEVDLSEYSEEYRKAYYDGWNNCNMQHSQCKSELDDVVKCLINGMKFYYEDNEEATWGTDKWSMPVKHIIEVLEKQVEQKPADKVEPKFKVGDIISNGISEVKIVSIDKNNYNVTNGGIENDAHAGNWVVYFKDQDNWKLKEQNSAWSEEDEYRLNEIILDLKVFRDTNCSRKGKAAYQREIDWLKSLKDRVQPQLQWKPSAFHLECITDAISMYEGRGINAIGLKEILDDLKKLREE